MGLFLRALQRMLDEAQCLLPRCLGHELTNEVRSLPLHGPCIC